VLRGPLMSAQCCREAGHGSYVSRRGWRRTKTTTGLGVPAIILAALVPKCPMCVAAYGGDCRVRLRTGAGGDAHRAVTSLGALNQRTETECTTSSVVFR
jgi:hypothetical protein